MWLIFTLLTYFCLIFLLIFAYLLLSEQWSSLPPFSVFACISPTDIAVWHLNHYLTPVLWKKKNCLSLSSYAVVPPCFWRDKNGSPHYNDKSLMRSYLIFSFNYVLIFILYAGVVRNYRFISSASFIWLNKSSEKLYEMWLNLCSFMASLLLFVLFNVCSVHFLDNYLVSRRNYFFGRRKAKKLWRIFAATLCGRFDFALTGTTCGSLQPCEIFITDQVKKKRRHNYGCNIGFI